MTQLPPIIFKNKRLDCRPISCRNDELELQKIDTKVRAEIINEQMVFMPTLSGENAEYILNRIKEIEHRCYQSTTNAVKYIELFTFRVHDIKPPVTNSPKMKIEFDQNHLQRFLKYILERIGKETSYSKLDKTTNGRMTDLFQRIRNGCFHTPCDFTREFFTIVKQDDKTPDDMKKCLTKLRKKFVIIATPLFQNVGYCCAGDFDDADQRIQCSCCHRIFHKGCELYLDAFSPAGFECRCCRLHTGRPSLSSKYSAKGLPRTDLTDAMERGINDVLKDDLKGYPCEPVFVRMVYNNDEQFSTRAEVQQMFGYPKEIPYRRKVFFVFQNIGGADVAIFSLEVHEGYDENFKPNHRCIYISYMDSLKYFEPKDSRRTVYYQMLLTYLCDAKERGFLKFYIWMCSPEPGTSYVFYDPPKRNVSMNTLRKFYNTLLDTAKKQGIIRDFGYIEDCPLFDDCDFEQLPYFKDDYIINRNDKFLDSLGPPKKRMKSDDNNNNNNNKGTIMNRLRRDIKSNKKTLIIANVSPENQQPLVLDHCPTFKCDMVSSHFGFIEYQQYRSFSFHKLPNAQYTTLRMLYDFHHGITKGSSPHDQTVEPLFHAFNCKDERCQRGKECQISKSIIHNADPDEMKRMNASIEDFADRLGYIKCIHMQCSCYVKHPFLGT